MIKDKHLCFTHTQASAGARDMALGLYERDPIHPLNPDMVRQPVMHVKLLIWSASC